MNPIPDKATALAATDQIKAAAAPRIKLLSHGYSIDHPDPELGEQLMADALGVADRDAMHGILRQYVMPWFVSSIYSQNFAGQQTSQQPLRLTLPSLRHSSRQILDAARTG